MKVDLNSPANIYNEKETNQISRPLITGSEERVFYCRILFASTPEIFRCAEKHLALIPFIRNNRSKKEQKAHFAIRFYVLNSRKPSATFIVVEYPITANSNKMQ